MSKPMNPFVIGAIILVAVIAGGAFYAQQRSHRDTREREIESLTIPDAPAPVATAPLVWHCAFHTSNKVMSVCVESATFCQELRLSGDLGLGPCFTQADAGCFVSIETGAPHCSATISGCEYLRTEDDTVPSEKVAGRTECKVRRRSDFTP